jgi:dTDP-4-dehydrorhamnose reductase
VVAGYQGEGGTREVTARWLVLGAGGQLGTDLMRVLDGHDVVGLTRHELDITDTDAVARTVAAVVPSVIVNAAAYTAVDAAETDEGTAFAANVTAPAALAAAAAVGRAKFVHISTDYVFSGDATVPYDEAAATGPKSFYGRTKLAGDQAVFAELPDAYIVRTAWVYGASGANFVKTMARLERERETVSVVDDQRGSPTWSYHLARGLVALGSSGADGGIYHCTNTGETTWFGFTRAIFEELGADPERVLPTTTAAFPRPAPRPAYSVLGNRRWIEAGLDPLPQWRAALHDAFASAPDALRGTAK